MSRSTRRSSRTRKAHLACPDGMLPFSAACQEFPACQLRPRTHGETLVNFALFDLVGLNCSELRRTAAVVHCAISRRTSIGSCNCAAAGVDATLHQLRHTHATELVNAGVSLATIRKRL